MRLQKLYLRIWLAVVMAVAVLTLLMGWVWRMASEPPLREVVVRNPAGEIIGKGTARFMRAPVDANPRMDPDGDVEAPGRYGEGPEFDVHMQNGEEIHLHMPRPPRMFGHGPNGFVWTLGLVAVAVALATYPIVRRLTRRLEELQVSVDRWGQGDLSTRAQTSGNDEVAFLATRFNHAAEQVESLVAARDALLASQKSLLANASHELRSPLTRIRMGLEFMGGADAGASSQTAKAEIARNINELDLLIEEILLASRLDAREADLGSVERVDLVGLVAEECARVDATLDLHVPGNEMVVPGVTKLLRRAVRNLLENARRHAAGDVLAVISGEDGMAEVRVCDRGPGVPLALQARIFEPFYRLPGASEKDGGVGLGLALVKSITVRHGGSVACTSRPEGGACFSMRLPMATPGA